MREREREMLVNSRQNNSALVYQTWWNQSRSGVGFFIDIGHLFVLLLQQWGKVPLVVAVRRIYFLSFFFSLFFLND